MAASKTIQIIIGRLRPAAAGRLAAILENDAAFEVLRSDVDWDEVHAEIARHLPRVIVVDESVEHLQLRLLKSGPLAPGIVVLADNPSTLYAELLEGLGVGCVPLTAPRSDLHAAVEGAALWNAAQALGLESALHSLSARLTPAETKVFHYLTRGASYREIGSYLHIAPETARSHTRSICQKFGVSRKRDLIGFALG